MTSSNPRQAEKPRKTRPMNHLETVRARRKINMALAVVFLLLLTWLGAEVAETVQRFYRATQPLTAKRIQLVRQGETVTLSHEATGWRIGEPYAYKASPLVVEALLARLQHSCRQLSDSPARMPQWHAEIIVDDKRYHIGERNPASGEVYVKHQDKWLLCDNLLLSMAMAPAINFVDKQLYEGELHAIVGSFGRLSDFQGMDLSVLEIAQADAEKLPQQSLATLTFVADNKRVYQAFLSEDGKHLLLFDEGKSLLYVIAANSKFNAVLGL